MAEVNTRWTHATKNPSEALAGLVSCLEAGNNAWLELRDNGDQEFPIMKVNPKLDDPFNWTMMCGVPRNEKEMREKNYLNETEKDLTFNWMAGFGTKEAVEKYQQTGEVTEGLLSGVGVSSPVRIKDADFYRAQFTGDNYKYGFFVTYWKPKDGIKQYIPDESVGKVFTVCCSNGPVDKKEAARKAAAFLLAYADGPDA